MHNFAIFAKLAAKITTILFIGIANTPMESKGLTSFSKEHINEEECKYTTVDGAKVHCLTGTGYNTTLH